MTKSRQEIMMAKLLKEFETNPIIGAACHKVGLSRATYYRWREESMEFELKADFALAKGRAVINDLAESQLINAIKDQRIGAIALWLRFNHPIYVQKHPNPPKPYKGTKYLPYDD